MVLIIDFGSQYTELLFKKIRANQVFAELIDCDDENLINEASKYDALVISGSPNCASDELHEEIIKKIISLGKPVLAICYGMQVIHKMMGGEVVYGQCSEFGDTKISIINDEDIVDGLPMNFKMWMSHNDSVIKLAPGFTSVAETEKCHCIAVHKEKRIYTLQFHPEVEHSEFGGQIISNFLFFICKQKKSWNTENIIQSKLNEIRKKVESNTVYLAVSGGLDSSVVGKLLKLSEVDVHYIFVNTGLLCLQKSAPVIQWLKEEFGDRLIIVDAEDRFFRGLKGVIDPEAKRNTVGKLFVEIFKEEIQKHGGSKYLAQGTIRSDIIESGKRRQSHSIKTHHNTIEELKESFEIIEPISDLFKDETRELAKELGLPNFIVNSQPFPGPGYAIRVLGEVTKEKTEIVRKADEIIHEELLKRGILEKTSQCFAVILNSKSVGVVGDRRNYGYVLAIRSVDTNNMMTAKASCIPIEVLSDIAGSITNKIPEIARVVYDLTSKPPATIEWE